MSMLVDLTGQRFGRLIVVDRAENSSHGNTRWNCKCDCGNNTIVWAMSLNAGRTKSCGCFQRDKHITHSGSYTKEWHVWVQIKQRCYNHVSSEYKNYGGRGIKVCDRWKFSFENFLEDVGKCPDGMSIERINNNGDYTPENCEWATSHIQHRNMRTNVWVNFNGEQMVLEDAITRLRGVITRRSFFAYRARHGISAQETVDHYLSL